MDAIEFINWHKSTRSDADGNCVEVGISRDGTMIGIRDTKDRDGLLLTFPVTVWQGFLAGVRGGEFDVEQS